MLSVNNKMMFHLFLSSAFIFNIYSNIIGFLYGSFPIYIMILGVGLIFSFLIKAKKHKVASILCWWLVITLLVFYFIQLFIIIESSAGSYQIGYSFEKHRYLLFTMPLYVLLGVFIAGINESERLTKVDLGLLFMIALSIFINSSFTLFRLDFNSFIGGHAVYLLLGDFLAFIGFYYLVKCESLITKYLVCFLFLSLLFFIYSRTSLYFYFLTAAFYLSRHNYKVFFALFFMIITSFVLLIKQINFSFEEVGYGINRMFFIFSNEQDSSANQRIDILNSQLSLLFDNWYLGDYAGQVQLYGKWGAYIHSFISVWRQFGFLAFLIYLQFMVFSFYYIFKFLRSPKFASVSSLPILFMLYSLLAVIFSRSYVYPYFYMYFGCVIGLCYLNNRKIKVEGL